jgi:hypothetical protein
MEAHKIDFADNQFCYEDSDGDLNAISDDEDLKTAKTYAQMKQDRTFRTSLVNK